MSRGNQRRGPGEVLRLHSSPRPGAARQTTQVRLRFFLGLKDFVGSVRVESFVVLSVQDHRDFLGGSGLPFLSASLGLAD